MGRNQVLSGGREQQCIRYGEYLVAAVRQYRGKCQQLTRFCVIICERAYYETNTRLYSTYIRYYSKYYFIGSLQLVLLAKFRLVFNPNVTGLLQLVHIITLY